MATKIFFIAGCVLAVAANVVRVVQDQGNGYQDETKYYEPKKTDYEPIKTDYKTKHVICVGVDVTNNCIYRADGNYAIDNNPRSGYVACVNKRPICMPCQYGLVFCANSGYKSLGQCLGLYDECPPRPY